ncbi:tRNA (adenosine(37)-N6)-threonylcarbamoyltransferase complex dimerization subunit type 1 TsaB [Sedimentibacter sp. zth1]|uniref:tRNA (adenosine(37)-N6)-threonylcarbamoyltransferase complex dimerization subunit type 1 TsaB n=1 Tax=Sedimentibacter sp. zth1 TaxID=2816908 RepID=UPI001A91A94C|nr:tRNA (adenosine(37)-N6)-threonylcarbamoyltransferase complex dimerization subunit type 1 TsaB [Sedimentibacter sp. zth1]QSX07012.1 tRNA (adenosine(37)-N6)-threonylcarbamoyltransferase complex dimerization subunit type 1 TsaB [Sedimentibacter sp. zth1]
MKILGIESASITASCAVAENDILLCEYSQSFNKTHSEKLMPLIVQSLEDNSIQLDDIQYVAISKGPGSYTGLRIGASIAKGIALAKNLPIVAVPTMKSLACNVLDYNNYIVSIIDAKGNRTYAGIYKWDGDKLCTIKEQFPTDIEDLIDVINSLGSGVVVNGDGSVVYKDILSQNVKVPIKFAPQRFNILKASSICYVAYQMILDDKVIKSFEFAPEYLRPSQAERMCKG